MKAILKVQVTTAILSAAVLLAPATGTADPLVLWNKLGAEAEILNSAHGPDLQFYTGGSWIDVVGVPTYVSGKFDGAVGLGPGPYFIQARVHNIVLNDLPNYIDPEQGTIEVWYKQTTYPVSYSHGIYRLFDGSCGLGSGMGFECGTVGPDPRLRFGLAFGGPWVSVYSLADGNPGYDISDMSVFGDWNHLAAVWDRDGIGGSTDTLQLYLNGQVVAAATDNSWGTSVGDRADICGGNDHIADRFYMDNLQVWDFAKTDFTDRFVEGPTLPVAIDIKPGSDPNSINLTSKGSIPVAIFSRDTFDAATVDPVTVSLAGADVRVRGRGTPMSAFEDVDGDGLLDLVLHVETEGLELTGTDVQAALTGLTFDGLRISGVDTVRIVREASPVPEPATLSLLVLGGLALIRRRRIV